MQTLSICHISDLAAPGCVLLCKLHHKRTTVSDDDKVLSRLLSHNESYQTGVSTLLSKHHATNRFRSPVENKMIGNVVESHSLAIKFKYMLVMYVVSGSDSAKQAQVTVLRMSLPQMVQSQHDSV